MSKKPEPSQNLEKMLTTWGIIVILWSIFRANFQPPLWFSEFLAKPLIFLIPVYIYLKKNEKAGNFLYQVGFPKTGLGRELMLSLSLVFFIVGMGILTFFFSDSVRLLTYNAVNYFKIGEIFLLSLATSISEEILGRGFLFNYLHKHSKSFLISLFISATLFFVLYLPSALTLKIGGPDLFFNLLFNFTMSFITGIAFYLRKNILASITVHASILLWFDLFLR